jgi:hypothetical protein
LAQTHDAKGAVRRSFAAISVFGILAVIAFATLAIIAY